MRGLRNGAQGILKNYMTKAEFSYEAKRAWSPLYFVKENKSV